MHLSAHRYAGRSPEAVGEVGVTLRERDSTKQFRASWSDVVDAVVALSSGDMVWSDLASMPDKYKPFSSTGSDDK